MEEVTIEPLDFVSGRRLTEQENALIHRLYEESSRVPWTVNHGAEGGVSDTYDLEDSASAQVGGGSGRWTMGLLKQVSAASRERPVLVLHTYLALRKRSYYLVQPHVLACTRQLKVWLKY